MNTNSYKVVINNEEYNLVSDEGQARVALVAQVVDKTIQELSAQAPKLDKKKIAVLAALQIASELAHLRNVITEQQEQEMRLASLIDTTLLSL